MPDTPPFQNFSCNIFCMDTKTQELRTSFANLLAEVKAAEPDKDYLYRALSYVHERMNQMEDMHHKHKDDGHIPPIKGAGNMKKVLAKLGMDEDYEVKCPVIYARKNQTFEVTYSK